MPVSSTRNDYRDMGEQPDRPIRTRLPGLAVQASVPV